MFYNSPLYSVEDRLEIAIGTIDFYAETIVNLRLQIVALRKLVEENYSKEFIDNVQYEHLK